MIIDRVRVTVERGDGYYREASVLRVEVVGGGRSHQMSKYMPVDDTESILDLMIAEAVRELKAAMKPSQISV